MKTKTIKKIFIFKIILFVLILTGGLSSRTYAVNEFFYITGGGDVLPGQLIEVSVYANRDDTLDTVGINLNFSNLSYISGNYSSDWNLFPQYNVGSNSISFTGATTFSATNKLVMSITFQIPDIPGQQASISANGHILKAGDLQVASSNNVVFNVLVPMQPIESPQPEPEVIPQPTVPMTTPDIQVTPQPTTIPLPKKIVVISTTNPDEKSWNKSGDVVFTWQNDSTLTEFSYELTKDKNYILDESSEGNVNSKTYKDLSSGVYYFFLKAKNTVGWGETSVFQVKIDKNSPDDFTITKINPNNGQNFVLYFATNDKHSGIAGYSMILDGKEIGEVKSGVEIPVNSREVVVKAYDYAGNTKETRLILADADDSKVVSLSSIQDKVKDTESNEVEKILMIFVLLLVIYSIMMSYLYFSQKKFRDLFSKRKTVE